MYDCKAREGKETFRLLDTVSNKRKKKKGRRRGEIAVLFVHWWGRIRMPVSNRITNSTLESQPNNSLSAL